jgi:hypothetical protein
MGEHPVGTAAQAFLGRRQRLGMAAQLAQTPDERQVHGRRLESVVAFVEEGLAAARAGSGPRR